MQVEALAARQGVPGDLPCCGCPCRAPRSPFSSSTGIRSHYLVFSVRAPSRCCRLAPPLEGGGPPPRFAVTRSSPRLPP